MTLISSSLSTHDEVQVFHSPGNIKIKNVVAAPGSAMVSAWFLYNVETIIETFSALKKEIIKDYDPKDATIYC